MFSPSPNPKHTAIIAVGANLSPRENIERAKSLLPETVELKGSVPLIRTRPVGFANQPDFLNGAWWVATKLNHTALVAACKQVEQAVGRVKTERKDGPRVLDLDVVMHDQQVVHPDLAREAYLYLPVLALAERQGIALDLAVEAEQPAEAMSALELVDALSERTEWALDDSAIVREITCEDFPAALRLVNAIGELAEAANHHPDIDIRYNVVRLSLSTHSAGGLTEQDFALASEIDISIFRS